MKTKKKKRYPQNLYLGRDLKKLRIIKMPTIPISVNALRIVQQRPQKALRERDIRERIKTIKSTTLLKSAPIFSFTQTSVKVKYFVKNSQGGK